MKFHNCQIIGEVRLYNKTIEDDGTAYIIDRLGPQPTPEMIREWENAGAVVSERVHRHAPEIKETFVFVPDSVMKWACPNEECDGFYLNDPQILEFSNGWHTCPNCGCSTVAPIEDACIPMIELV